MSLRRFHFEYYKKPLSRKDEMPHVHIVFSWLGVWILEALEVATWKQMKVFIFLISLKRVRRTSNSSHLGLIFRTISNTWSYCNNAVCYDFINLGITASEYRKSKKKLIRLNLPDRKVEGTKWTIS